MVKSVILFEANEVPKRLVDDHVARRPDGALAKIVGVGRFYETRCDDEIELDPWISWPSLHRGVNDAAHRVLHLGQSLDWADREYPPVWRLLHGAGVRVGVFGSLHSSHTPPDARDYEFYVPDFFAAEAFAHPQSLLPFQEFNLVMTRRSARNIDPGLPVREAARFGASALANGLSVNAMAKIGAQLAEERITPTRKIRRRNIQGVIGTDLFLSLLRQRRPQFSTFYTNHVAAAMHRYWGAYFTGDYGAENPMGEDWIAKYRDEVPHAMDVLDDMLGKVLAYVEDSDDTVLMLASSLGQAAIQEARPTDGFTTIVDVDRLMAFLGFEPGQYRTANAMAPCISIDLDPDIAGDFEEKLIRTKIMGAEPVRDEREIAPLSYDIKNGRSAHLYFYFEGQRPEGDIVTGNRAAPLEEAGLGFFIHEDNVACSAHHIPEGILGVYDPSADGRAANGASEISTLDIAPALLRNFGADVPGYMKADAGLTI